jgi:hypothetical protein
MWHAWKKKLLGKQKGSKFHSLPLEQREGAEALLLRVRNDKLTYVGVKKLENLCWAALATREKGVVGDYIEAGVALGGTAILLAALKPAASSLVLYDVFGLIPPPGPVDGQDAHQRYAVIASGESSGIGGDKYYGYTNDLEDVVKGNLAKYGFTEKGNDIRLVKGLISETLEPEGPVALAHIDCDWYESVKVCIDRIYPKLAVNGMMVFDDYQSYSGCRKAVDEFVSTEPSASVVFAAKSVAIQRGALASK